MTRQIIALLAVFLFCIPVMADETSDGSADSAEKPETQSENMEGYSDIMDYYDENREKMTIGEYLSQTPKKYKYRLFGIERKAEVLPRRFFLSVGIATLSGNLDADFTSKKDGSKAKVLQPDQKGTAYTLGFGFLEGKSHISDFSLYFGNTEGTGKENEASAVKAETITSVFGFDFTLGYNLNLQGIHRGVILGGGLGGQQITITDKLILFNNTVTESKTRAEVFYLSGKIGYGYLFDNGLYLTSFLAGGLPFHSSYKGSDGEEFSSSEHLFLNPLFRVSLQGVF